MALQKALFGLDVYVDGIDYLVSRRVSHLPRSRSRSSSRTCPGHAGPIDVPSGRLEGLEASFVMADSIPRSRDSSAIRRTGYPGVVRGSDDGRHGKPCGRVRALRVVEEAGDGRGQEWR